MTRLFAASLLALSLELFSYGFIPLLATVEVQTFVGSFKHLFQTVFGMRQTFHEMRYNFIVV